MVQTLKQSLRKCLLDHSWNMPWDSILPYVAMGYRVSKQKSTGFSPYFLLYGRQPLFPSSVQHVDEQIIDDEDTNIRNFQLELKNRGAALREVMPLAMRNLAIAQQRDKERYVRTLAVHCKICGSRGQEAKMLLCDVCNMGYHTFCLPVPLDRIPDMRWKCDVHR